jgi:hypothetical protein
VSFNVAFILFPFSICASWSFKSYHKGADEGKAKAKARRQAKVSLPVSP